MLRIELAQRKWKAILAVALIAAISTSSFVFSPVGEATAAEVEVLKLPNTPIYGRTYLGDDEWSMVAFFHNIDCMDDDSDEDVRFFGGDLVSLVWIDFEALGCDESHVANTLHLFDGGVKRQSLTGTGDLPVWFIRTSDLMASLDGDINFDDVFFWDQLQELDRIEGVASKFREENHTNVSGTPFLQATAKGTLEDGREFSFNSVHHLHRDGLGVPSNPENAVVKFK